MQAGANTAHVASATDVATGPTLNLDNTDSLWHTRCILQFAFCAASTRNNDFAKHF